MKNNLKSFLLRLLPYIVSIIIGLTIFAIVKRIEQKEEDISNLLINISSDLLSIPLVFICYEVVNNIINKDLNDTLFKSTTFNIGSIILNIVNNIRNIMGYTDIVDKDNLDEFLKLDKKDIVKKIKFDKINKDILDIISKNSKDLYTIMHQQTTLKVLDAEQIRNLLYLSRELDILFNKLSLIMDRAIDIKEKTLIAKNLENIINSIKDWVETTEIDALIKHQEIKVF